MDNYSNNDSKLSAAKAAVGDALGKAGTASATHAKKAGNAVVTVAKRSPVPALSTLLSFYWLYKTSADPEASPSPAAFGPPTGLNKLIQDSPLAVGILGLAVGVAIGLLIPETDKENELMGETRDRLADQAQQTVQEFAQKVGVVAATAGTAAQDALGTAKDAATGALGQVKDAAADALGTVKGAATDVFGQVKDAATEAAGTVTDEAKKQGLVPNAN